ncbi:MAG: hypothetical protein GY842_01730 [bacterium]|nr:hypothetical protein [bacterium]
MSAQPSEPDVTEAIRKFLAIEDAGLTESDFDAFLRWCERRGPQYVKAVGLHLSLMAELPAALEDLMSAKDRDGDS